jgi:hypothetical protein
MSRQIQMTIPQPCDENWGDMTPTEKGRFCASCCKQVIDFTNMSDSQLAAFFRKSRLAPCAASLVMTNWTEILKYPRKEYPG